MNEIPNDGERHAIIRERVSSDTGFNVIDPRHRIEQVRDVSGSVFDAEVILLLGGRCVTQCNENSRFAELMRCVSAEGMLWRQRHHTGRAQRVENVARDIEPLGAMSAWLLAEKRTLEMESKSIR
jgi:hypothetical protein